MGCDIHSVIQYQDDYHKRWIDVCYHIGDNRNYDTFAVYADVRNGRGFAGVDTGHGWKPIAQPRGFPEDFEHDEEDHRFQPDRWPEDDEKGCVAWMGDHSHSWLTLSEMEEKWRTYEGQQYEVHGVVSKDVYQKTIAKGKAPEEYCGGISGPGVTVITEQQRLDGHPFSHVRTSWKVPATDCLYTMQRHIALMQAIRDAEGLKSDQVRIVFGFDS